MRHYFDIEDFTPIREEMQPYQRYLLDMYQFNAGYTPPTDHTPLYQVHMQAFLNHNESTRMTPLLWQGHFEDIQEVRDEYNNAVHYLLNLTSAGKEFIPLG